MVILKEIQSEKADKVVVEDVEEDYSDDQYTDDDEDDEEEFDDESLLDRIYALKDIIPPNQRLAISNTVSSVYNGVHTAFSIIGKTGWVLSTSAFVVLLPLMIAYEKDQELLMRSGQYPGMEQGAQPQQPEQAQQ